MKLKTTVLCAMLAPGLMMLAACGNNDTTQADDVVPPVDSMAADTMPADDMMADPMPADGMPDGEMGFADMDKNGDGGVTMDELVAGNMLYDHFAVADADGNGSLSEDEIAKHKADMAAMPVE